MRSTIISAPERQTFAQRSLYSTLTLLVWLGWIYLWLPLLTAIAWGLGFFHAYDQVGPSNNGGSLDNFLLLLQLAGVSALILVLWACYNYFRFGGRERRSYANCVTADEIAEYFQATELVSHCLRYAASCVLHLDADGRPLRTQTDRGGAALNAAFDHEHGYDLRPQTSLHPQTQPKLNNVP